MKHILAAIFFVASSALYAAIPTAKNNVNWEPGVTVGVRGGIPTTRTVAITVTDAPYNASGSIVETTGNITSGSPTLTVASATSFAVGHGIKIGYVEIQELEVTGGASSTGNERIILPSHTGDDVAYNVAVTSGDTATQVATKIRAATYPGWETSGTGTTVRWTYYTPRNINNTVWVVGDRGVSGTGSVVQQGVQAALTSISAISGTTITLAANSSATLVNGTVEHDDLAAFQAAVNAATADQIVYAPAGDYNLNGSIMFDYAKSDRTLRGAGPGVTTLWGHQSGAVTLGSGDNYTYPFGGSLGNITVSAGLSKGSSTITIPNTTGFGNGQPVSLQFEDDLTKPAFSTGGLQFQTRQLVVVTGKTSTTLTFTPPLYENYGSGSLTAYAATPENAHWLHNSGVEDLTIKYYPAIIPYEGIKFENAVDCWAKNVELVNVGNYGVGMQYAAFCEVRRTKFNDQIGGGSNHSGLLLNFSSACLIEDNIFENQFPNIEVNFGSSGNAVSRNYLNGPIFGIDSNHAPHNQFNLYEANYNRAIAIADGYFGSVSNDTWFRNWLAGPVALKRMTREYEFYGNFIFEPISFGQPNIGNTDSTGTIDWTTTKWADWGSAAYLTGTLLTRTSDSVGVIRFTTTKGQIYVGQVGLNMYWNSRANQRNALRISSVSSLDVGIENYDSYTTGSALPAEGTTVIVYTGISGYQELDGGVESTTILKGNRYLHDNSFESLGGDTLVDSLLYGSTKPQWMLDEETHHGVTFNLAAWDPVTGTTPTADKIPAGYRAINGDSGGGGGGGASTLSVGTVNATTLNVGSIIRAP